VVVDVWSSNNLVINASIVAVLPIWVMPPRKMCALATLMGLALPKVSSPSTTESLMLEGRDASQRRFQNLAMSADLRL
jgi:hypothetical protein